MAHDQALNSITSGRAHVAAAFRGFAQAVCLAAWLFPAALSAEEVDNRAYRLAPGDRISVGGTRMIFRNVEGKKR